MNHRPVVLVLDGEQRSALAVVRSLGRNGCRVHVASHAYNPPAGGSRYALTESRLPDPLQGSAAYCAAVNQLARKYDAELVFPVTEASTIAVLESGLQRTGIVLPVTDLDKFNRACDKAQILALAGRAGIAVPAQWNISGAPGTELEVPVDQFPVVAKPARSVAGADGNRFKVGVQYADSPGQLGEALRRIGPEAGPFLIQSRIEGPGLGVFLLRWGGEVVASFAHRRIREKPPSGGVSVCCESTVAPTALIAQSTALLEAIDWTGVAMVEFKHDTRSGRDYLMEINPRFWGSLQLAIDAGVDFPWYLAQLALGHPMPQVHTWRIGLRSRWRLGELDHLIARLLHSRAALHLPADAPSIARTLAAVLIPWMPGQRSEVLRLSDPNPGLREALNWLREL